MNSRLFRRTVPSLKNFIRGKKKEAPECAPKDKEVVSPKFKRLKMNQQMFQENDGKPVWLKKGMDKMLFKGTLALMAVNMVLVVETLGTLVVRDW